MNFEWDRAKNLINQIKRQIAFEDILGIFDGPVLEVEDNRKDYGETRIKALGELNGLLLCVIYTWRGLNRRIISARVASRNERQVYYGQD
jgi:uncharacterized DUF497 family protein